MIFLKSGDAEIKKIDFHNSKEVLNVMSVDTQQRIVPDAFVYGKKKKQMKNVS